jgi:putative radical SAM enzyme (TIGR03279 family)
VIRKPSGELWEAEFELDEDESLGVEWESIRPRTCCNKCVFCFVDQLPPGVRPSLLIKDEDYRHSFLYGNFITLGNFTERDLARVVEQRLSPLYISVHSTSPEVRRQLVGCPVSDRFFDYFDRLVDHGITLHTQIVVCPGLNDGEELLRSVTDLAGRYPAVKSVGVVPVGLTDFRAGLHPLAPPDPDFCRTVIRQLHPLQQEYRRRLGIGLVYLADEFYLQAGRRLPPGRTYDDYPQLENGIGMARDFLEEFGRIMRRSPRRIVTRNAVFPTGALFAPLLRRCLDRFNGRFGTDLRAVAVPNRFLGGRVTVTGLLAGKDIARAVPPQPPADFVGIPFHCLSRTRDIFVDDLTLEELAGLLGRPVCPLSPGPEGLWRALTEPPDLVYPSSRP